MDLNVAPIQFQRFCYMRWGNSGGKMAFSNEKADVYAKKKKKIGAVNRQIVIAMFAEFD